jgi:hypothetical protein
MVQAMSLLKVRALEFTYVDGFARIPGLPPWARYDRLPPRKIIPDRIGNY